MGSSYQPATDDYTGNQGSKWAEILWRRGRVLSQYGSMSSAQWQQLGLWGAANCQPRLLGSSVGNSSESNAAIPVEEEVLMETSSGGSYCVAQHIQNHAIGRCYSSYQPAADDYKGNHGSKWAEILWRRGRVLSQYGSVSSSQWHQLGLWCAANCQPRLLGSSVDNSSESNAAILVEEEAALLMGGDQDIKLESGSYYPYHRNWNCYTPGAPSTDGYRGVRGTDSCARQCDQTSWCVGFVYMRGQSKCWLRPSGIRCVHSTGGEAASFDWYGSLR